MFASSLHREMLTVERVTTGPPVRGIAPETIERTTWGPCNVQRTGTSEARGDQEATTSRYRASGPLAEWIKPGDRIHWQDRLLQVEGDPAHFIGGVIDHSEVYLVTWTGV